MYSVCALVKLSCNARYGWKFVRWNSKRTIDVVIDNIILCGVEDGARFRFSSDIVVKEALGSPASCGEMRFPQVLVLTQRLSASGSPIEVLTMYSEWFWEREHFFVESRHACAMALHLANAHKLFGPRSGRQTFCRRTWRLLN